MEANYASALAVMGRIVKEGRLLGNRLMVFEWSLKHDRVAEGRRGRHVGPSTNMLF